MSVQKSNVLKRTSEKATIRKRLDTQLPAEALSRSNVTLYWMKERYAEIYKAFRPWFTKIVPKSADPFDQRDIISRFNLKGVEYGNWLSQEDRFNYFMALEIALYDLQGILNFGYNIGLGNSDATRVGVAFGARGKSSALAHFEPDTFMINLTRYKEVSSITDIFGRPKYPGTTTGEVKDQLFYKTGGVGSLGHEYGHALDFWFGTFIEQDRRYLRSRALTNAHSTSTRPDVSYPKNTMRYHANMIIQKLIWVNPGERYTAYYKRMEAAGLSEYWFRHAELFARAFEVYLSFKLNQKGIKNTFLTKNKYDSDRVKHIYPSGATLQAVIPHFDKLITLMRHHLK